MKALIVMDISGWHMVCFVFGGCFLPKNIGISGLEAGAGMQWDVKTINRGFWR